MFFVVAFHWLLFTRSSHSLFLHLHYAFVIWAIILCKYDAIKKNKNRMKSGNLYFFFSRFHFYIFVHIFQYIKSSMAICCCFSLVLINKKDWFISFLRKGKIIHRQRQRKLQKIGKKLAANKYEQEEKNYYG